MPYLLLTLAPLFWAGNFVVARGIHEIVPPLSLAFWRWVLALAIYLLIFGRPLLHKRRLLLGHWKLLAVLGLTSVTNFSIFIYLALHVATVVNTALINSFYPILIVVFSWIGYRERVTARQAAGILISLGGLLWILSRGRPAMLLGLHFSTGDLYTLAAGVNWALYSVLLRKKPAGLDHFAFLGAIMCWGTLFLLPAYWIGLRAGQGFSLSVPAIGGILYVAVFPSILSYLCWNKGVEKVGANVAGIFVHLIPVFSILLALLLLGEKIRVFQIAGMVLIFAGIFLTTFRHHASTRRGRIQVGVSGKRRDAPALPDGSGIRKPRNTKTGGVTMLQTTIAGSLPKPDWLADPQKLWASWRLEGEALQRGKERAAAEWLRHQQEAGIDIVTNGEQFRVHFVHGFLEKIEGIDWEKKPPMGIRDNRYTVLVPTVTGPVSRPRPVHLEEVRYSRSQTDRKLKFSLPGPMTICDTIADEHYGYRPDMAMAFAQILNQEARELAAAGVDVIQFDEPAFNVFMDDVKQWGITALHRAIEGLTCTTAVHICYGYGIEENLRWKTTLGGEWRQYEEIFPALNASRIDQISLECADSRVPPSLMRLLKDKDLLVGSVAVTADRVEQPEDVAAVIRSALPYVDPGRLYPCTNCGMAPIPYKIALGKLKSLAAGAAIVRSEL